ncbi:MAG: ATP-binding protein [Chitinophagales bacterium]|nr:ATP-binding protein [Chitinophagales bacterium]
MQEGIIQGKPSKLFFIDMLTRDITVSDAIGDLVDNAVDAARAEIYRNNQPTYDLFALKYENTKIQINFSENEFTIKDNAGGIPYEIAKNYAFCFGRPEDYSTGNFGSIGQFGIGMKRAFFKIGKKITVESSTSNEYFKIEIDVEKWKNEDDWNFSVSEKRDTFDINIGYGTKITITDLTYASKSLFSDPTYFNDLKKEIEIENWYNISKGMKMEINGVPLIAKDLFIKEDSSIGLVIGKWQHFYQKEGVDVRILCGIGEKGKKEDGGWYIFCNDRLILAAEQTKITGWSGKGDKVKGGPEYHSQYELFRGFVFFEAKDPSDFPWNTAKTGLNPEHPLYLTVKAKMIDMMRDVITFLNNLKAEKDGQGRGKNQPLSHTESKLASAKSLSLDEVALKSMVEVKFTAPEVERPKKIPKSTDSVIISYEVDTEKFQSVSTLLNSLEPKDVGLKTFEYFYSNEIA